MSLLEIVRVAAAKDLAETGGAHNQKGTNIHRLWAVARMLELEDEGKDFLLIFESIQDVAEFDSETEPTSVNIYQVKKKEGALWKLRDLTNLLELKSKKSAAQPLEDIRTSPLGKLYATVRAFKELHSTGYFVSNAGCDLPLQSGISAAVSLPCDLSGVEIKLAAHLSKALATFHAPDEPAPELGRLWVKKIDLHPGSAEATLIGLTHLFLKARSPSHAQQASALVEALLAKVGPLCAKTDACASFEELRHERGYSRQEFRRALATLETIPDVVTIVNGWLSTWPRDPAFGPIQQGRTRAEVGKIFQGRLAGEHDPQDAALIAAFDTWLTDHPIGVELAQPMHHAASDVAQNFAGIRPERLYAHFLMRAAALCADPTSEY